MFTRALRAIPGAVAALILSAAPSFANHALDVKHKVVHSRQRAAHHARAARWHRHLHRRSAHARAAMRVASRTTDDADISDDAGTGVPLTGKAIETGIASWYGPHWQGRRTASGVPFDENQLTAAHPWLPLGSKVRVQLVGTHRTVEVVINDRPGTRRRIIDLSREAARELGIIHNGTALVTLSR